MSLLEDAAQEAAKLLDELHIPYMLIGGLAVGFWGEPRATLDVDLSIWIDEEHFESTIRALTARLATRVQNPIEFAMRDRVLPVRASNGVPIDLLFARWPIERQGIERAVSHGNTQLRIASLDYLLFLKLISDRPKDLADAQALIRRHRGKFASEWLEGEISTLSEAAGQPELLLRFRRMLEPPETL